MERDEGGRSLGLFYCLILSGSPHLIVYKPLARKAPLSTCMLSTHATLLRMNVTSYMTLHSDRETQIRFAALRYCVIR
jgi:hypothetical protein